MFYSREQWESLVIIVSLWQWFGYQTCPERFCNTQPYICAPQLRTNFPNGDYLRTWILNNNKDYGYFHGSAINCSYCYLSL